MRGDESDDLLAQIPALAPAFLMMDPSPAVSRLHAGRRVVEALKAAGAKVRRIYPLRLR